VIKFNIKIAALQRVTTAGGSSGTTANARASIARNAAARRIGAGNNHRQGLAGMQAAGKTSGAYTSNLIKDRSVFMDKYNYDQLREEILAIRDTGRCNMLDTTAVQRAANDLEFYDLVIFIEENKRNYTHFIFYGKFE
jgi:hypothetical protein